MFSLYPKFDDKLKQLKHNTLVSYALFQILLFLIIAILSYREIIHRSIFFAMIFTTLILPLSLIVFARFRYNLMVSIFIVVSYLSAVYFLFLINNNTITAIAILSIIFFVHAVLTLLILNWQIGLTLGGLSIILMIIDNGFEKIGFLNTLPGNPLSILAFLTIIIPFLISVFILALSYSVTLKLIFKEYKAEFSKRQEYEELLIEKNIAVNEMNTELEENLAQLEEINDRLKIALQKAEESDKLKSSFLQNISHEIRTPLNAILGFLGLIKETNVKNECNQDEFIDLTIKSGRQLLQVISDIVELSEIDAGLVRLEESEVNFEDLLEEIFSNFLHVTKNKQIELILENKIKGPKAIIYSDKPKITQILNNLISNGIKFTKSGSVHVTCRLENDRIIIKVKDTGIGIEKNKLKVIFDKFKQVDTDLSRNYGGLGIGLTIVKGLLNSMAGTIDVKSEFGKGSELIVSLPYKPVNITEKKFSPEKPGVKRKITKILIAEDDPHNYLYLERVLKKKKLKILHAWNGKEAVDLFREHADIQMVLMDIKMPVMDGLQALKQCKEMRPEIPIIAVTAYAQHREQMKFKSYGFDGYLTKPVMKEDVLALFT